MLHVDTFLTTLYVMVDVTSASPPARKENDILAPPMHP